MDILGNIYKDKSQKIKNFGILQNEFSIDNDFQALSSFDSELIGIRVLPTTKVNLGVIPLHQEGLIQS